MILEKIARPKSHLRKDDLTPAQKKSLWGVMLRHQASQGFSYDRFFKEGFREWELLGIDNIKAQFLREHNVDLGGEVFYEAIGRARLKLAFQSRMREFGMSCLTVLTRFGKKREADFKEYERVGIHKIVAEFEREIAAYER